jgi:hypothetical protein
MIVATLDRMHSERSGEWVEVCVMACVDCARMQLTVPKNEKKHTQAQWHAHLQSRHMNCVDMCAQAGLWPARQHV